MRTIIIDDQMRCIKRFTSTALVVSSLLLLQGGACPYCFLAVRHGNINGGDLVQPSCFVSAAADKRVSDPFPLLSLLFWHELPSEDSDLAMSCISSHLFSQKNHAWILSIYIGANHAHERAPPHPFARYNLSYPALLHFHPLKTETSQIWHMKHQVVVVKGSAFLLTMSSAPFLVQVWKNIRVPSHPVDHLSPYRCCRPTFFSVYFCHSFDSHSFASIYDCVESYILFLNQLPAGPYFTLSKSLHTKDKEILSRCYHHPLDLSFWHPQGLLNVVRFLTYPISMAILPINVRMKMPPGSH